MSSEIQGPFIDLTEPADERRLDSWKEIAAFFQRDTRTVRRWEQTRNLPVRRVPGRRGYVFAYVAELDQWLRSADATAHEEEELYLGSAEIDEPEPPVVPAHIVAPVPAQGAQTWSRLGAGLAVASLLVLSIAALAFVRHRHRQTVAAAVSIVTATDLSESAKFTLRGKYYWDRRTEGGLQEALDAFTQAVVHDSTNARAYAGLAETYDLLPEYGKMENSVAFPRAIAAANRAISLDPTHAEAHRALGFALFFWDWDVNRALAEYRTSLQLDPLDFETHHWMATAFLTLGRGAESRAAIARARELRPTSRSILADQALINYSFHVEPAESIATLREIERTDPDFVTAPRYLARISFAERDFAQYMAEATRAASVAHDSNASALMDAANAGFRKDGERGMLQRMRAVQEQQFAKGQISGFELAKTCSAQGDDASAVHYLQSAFGAHDYMVMTVLSGDLDTTLKGSPAFMQLQNEVRRRMNRPT
jgi:cytochrome c-type biogenesis protein CcmH/NrfG